jgi:hypothetical protein
MGSPNYPSRLYWRLNRLRLPNSAREERAVTFL